MSIKWIKFSVLFVVLSSSLATIELQADQQLASSSTEPSSSQSQSQSHRQQQPDGHQDEQSLQTTPTSAGKQLDGSSRMTTTATTAAFPIGGELAGGLGDILASGNLLNTSQQLLLTATVKPEDLLPNRASLFNGDSLDEEALGQMDCHLRNLDLCLAGLLGSSGQRALPETEPELELRCDEMRVTTSCLATYNQKCQSFKVFAALAPFSGGSPSMAMFGGGTGGAKQSPATGGLGQQVQQQMQVQLPQQVEALLMNSNDSTNSRLSLQDLAQVCEPSQRDSAASKLIRGRLFALAKCANSRLPKLRPCLEDLKTALQLFYEPRRVLPLRPTCCALARFRSCSSDAMDRVCGLASFEQLLEQLGGSSGGGAGAGSQLGPLNMMRAIDRTCRRATDHRSAYCQEVLPAGGLRGPQRRGHKASKLAKALDLFSFSPAVQE